LQLGAPGTLSAASLYFTPADWNVAQTVTVLGVPGGGTAHEVAYPVQLTAGARDTGYEGLTASVTVTGMSLKALESQGELSQLFRSGAALPGPAPVVVTPIPVLLLAGGGGQGQEAQGARGKGSLSFVSHGGTAGAVVSAAEEVSRSGPVAAFVDVALDRREGAGSWLRGTRFPSAGELLSLEDLLEEKERPTPAPEEQAAASAAAARSTARKLGVL